MKKNKIRVTGVSNNKNLEEYATQIESEMNKLLQDGYRIIRISTEPTGTLLFGELDPPPRPDNLLSALFNPARGMHPITSALMDRMVEVDPNEGVEKLRLTIAPLVKDVDAATLRLVAKEIKEESALHEQTHPGVSCWMMKRFSDGAEIVAGLAESASN